MCGIVGLLVKKPALRSQLGELMVPMLIGMTERGPDSAGLAVFTDSLAESSRKISVYSGLTADGADFNWQALGHGIKTHLGVEASVEAKGNHAVITIKGAAEPVKHWIKEQHPKLHLLSTGRSIDLYKDIGTPAEVVPPSYTLVSVTAVTVIGLAVITPVFLLTSISATAAP